MAWLAFAVGCLVLVSPSVRGEVATEAALKAAYLVRFVGYVEWPAQAYASPEAPHVIAVVGADAVYAELQQVLAGLHPDGRQLLARRLAPGDTLEGVQLLYLGRGVAPAGLAEALAGRPVLVVTDRPGALDDIGVLNFLGDEQRVRFEASLPAAARAGLRLSSRLLSVAERVVP